MSVKIRLARAGRKKVPFYRIVVANSEAPRNGRFIENVGTYQPLLSEPVVTLKEDRIKEWLKKGAIPTETVANILKKNGIGRNQALATE